MLRVILIPRKTSLCPICWPNPDFIVIDGQALGCTDPYDAHPVRLEEDFPVLDTSASKQCVVEKAALRAALAKVLRSSAPLTETQEQLLRRWAMEIFKSGQGSAEGGAPDLFFHFFPLGGSTVTVRGLQAASSP